MISPTVQHSPSAEITQCPRMRPSSPLIVCSLVALFILSPHGALCTFSHAVSDFVPMSAAVGLVLCPQSGRPQECLLGHGGKTGVGGVFKTCARPAHKFHLRARRAQIWICVGWWWWEGRCSGRGFWTDWVFEDGRAGFRGAWGRMREKRGCRGGQRGGAKCKD